MNVLVLDPGLSQRQGHNPAILEELDRTLRGRPGVQVVCAASGRVNAADFESLHCKVEPRFAIDGYRRFSPVEILSLQASQPFEARVLANMQALPLEQFDLVLMPTVYPLHFAALAHCSARLRQARITCGMLMPTRFWSAGDDTVTMRLDQIVAGATHKLREHGNTFFYSETGRVSLGMASVPTPVLLPPISQETEALLESLEHPAVRLNAMAPIKVGYFGEPSDRKGFHFLVAVAQAALPQGIELVIRLPEGHDELCERLRAASPRIDARSATTDNESYFRAMAEVDFVLAFHDPKAYRDQMSGLLPEAICLGKPVLAGAGCTALLDFLERHAPGSHMTAEFHPEALRRALALMPERWLHCARHARASAPVVRAMKSAERYLSLAGLELDAWPRA